MLRMSVLYNFFSLIGYCTETGMFHILGQRTLLCNSLISAVAIITRLFQCVMVITLIWHVECCCFKANIDFNYYFSQTTYFSTFLLFLCCCYYCNNSRKVITLDKENL